MYEPIVAKSVNIFMNQLDQLHENSKTMINMAPRVHLFAMDTCMAFQSFSLSSRLIEKLIKVFELSHGTSMNFQTVGYDGYGGAAAEQRVLGHLSISMLAAYI